MGNLKKIDCPDCGIENIAFADVQEISCECGAQIPMFGLIRHWGRWIGLLKFKVIMVIKRDKNKLAIYSDTPLFWPVSHQFFLCIN